MKKILLIILFLIPVLVLAQKPDFVRSPNGPNTIVDWNVKFKTLIVPHGPTLGLFGAQDTTGHIRMVLNPGVDTSLYMYVHGVGWLPVSKAGGFSGSFIPLNFLDTVKVHENNFPLILFQHGSAAGLNINATEVSDGRATIQFHSEKGASQTWEIGHLTGGSSPTIGFSLRDITRDSTGIFNVFSVAPVTDIFSHNAPVWFNYNRGVTNYGHIDSASTVFTYVEAGDTSVFNQTAHQVSASVNSSGNIVNQISVGSGQAGLTTSYGTSTAFINTNPGSSFAQGSLNYQSPATTFKRITVGDIADGIKGVLVQDDLDQVGLNGTQVFPLSGDSTQYLQYGIIARLIAAAGGSGITALTGDGTAGGPGSVALTLATVNSNVGSFGDATHVAGFTVNAKGLITAASSTAITFPVNSVFGRTGAVVAASNDYTFAQIGSKPTTLSGYGITDILSQVLTGYTSGAGTVASTDNILQAIQKINGNDALKAPIASPSFTGTVTVGSLAGYIKGASGVLSAVSSIPYSDITGGPTTLSGTGYAKFAGSTPSYIASIPNADLANSTISGAALGTNLSTLTFGTHLAAGGSSYNGTTGVTITSDATDAATASVLVSRDANANTTINNLIENYSTTATAAGTTTLTVSSPYQNYFTGSTTQTVKLPVASTLVLGMQFSVVNLSTGVVTVQSSGANTVQAMDAGSSAVYTCILTSGTTAASWSVSYYGPASASSSGYMTTGTQTIAGGKTFSGGVTFGSGVNSFAGQFSATNFVGSAIRGNTNSSLLFGNNAMQSSIALTAFVFQPGTTTNSTGLWNNAELFDTYNQTSTASSTDFLIHRVETAIGSGTHKFLSFDVGGTEKFGMLNTGQLTQPLIPKNYTVSTLPTPSTYMLAFVSDASSPTFGATVVGGGSTVQLVAYNGSNWICQ